MKARGFIVLIGVLAAGFCAISQPAILVQPQDQSIIEGAGASFSVEASGTAPLAYQWLRFTNTSTHSIIAGETNAALLLTNPPATSHRFCVVVADSQGAVTSRLARLIHVLRVVTQPADQAVEQGLSATFVTTVAATIPFAPQWFFNQAPMPGETRTNLTLPDVQPEDTGGYHLVLGTSQGTVTSRVAALTVIPNTNRAPPAPPSFVNFETAPVHPVALSPDQSRLVVCNLADGRLEVFDVQSGIPRAMGSVPVGLDPVAARFRASNEVWVVNHISDSINIVDLDLLRVIATLPTLDAPADVVFAGESQRAFVSCAMENRILVFDPLTRKRIAVLPIEGERPKAMCVSPDGRHVYVAIFESGNASTILAPRYGLKDNPPPGPDVLLVTNGPYGGRNPPPNSGTNFSPPINANIPGTLPIPEEGHIVKKNAAGRWMDDNNGDWTDFVSGPHSEISGRIAGWDLPDHDIAIIDAENLEVRYASGLMNLCMAIAANPANGEVTVVGTDALNEMRFEPNLNGIFLRVNLARYHPLTQQKSITDLNPHLDYVRRKLPLSERQKSIGDPRAIVWNSTGTVAYVSGMGSGNLIAVDAAGRRRLGQPLALEPGACGMALDESRQRLYVLNRFAASLSVVDVTGWRVVHKVPLFDPTPAAVRLGRKHLYDTHKTSGLGHVSCASCHPEGRMDRLAWDLGDPAGPVVSVGPFTFHPMKGPMVTQTLQDIIGHEPLHWRGDRASIEAFNQTFEKLQSSDLLTTNEMAEFKTFLRTLTFPPNRFRNFDNSLATNLPLPGHVAVGTNQLLAGAPLPDGNALRGRDAFAHKFSCILCHRLQTGHGRDQAITPGPNGERRINSDVLLRNNARVFKDVQIRNLPDKLGMDLRTASGRTGFGFGFNGRVDSLSRFLEQGFATLGDQTTADTVAFLLSFVGSDLPTDDLTNGVEIDLPSTDSPASVGRQVTLTYSLPSVAFDQIVHVANLRRGRVQLIVRGDNRAWLYDRLTRRYQADRVTESASLEELRARASDTSPMTFLLVPNGTGFRAIDRDQDGYYDRDELDFGADPANPLSIPLRGRLVLNSNLLTVSWNSRTGQSYQLQFNDSLGPSTWSNFTEEIVATSTNTARDFPLSPHAHRFYRIHVK